VPEKINAVMIEGVVGEEFKEQAGLTGFRLATENGTFRCLTAVKGMGACAGCERTVCGHLMQCNTLAHGSISVIYADSIGTAERVKIGK